MKTKTLLSKAFTLLLIAWGATTTVLLMYSRGLKPTGHLLEAFSSVTTVLIATIVAYIAWQQLVTNREKLRLDLYEKRYGVYRAMMDLCRGLVSTGKVTDDDFYAYLSNAEEGAFLLGGEALAYLSEFRERAIKYHTLDQLLSINKPDIGEERRKYEEEKAELLSWFSGQFEVVRKRFQERYCQELWMRFFANRPSKAYPW